MTVYTLYLTDSIKAINPDIVVMSVLSDSFLLCQKIVTVIHSMNLPLVLGGIHPTIAPEECMTLDGVSAICRGEGEAPLSEFVEALQIGGDQTKIMNLWVKTSSGIVRNPLRPLQPTLDELPFPDYSIFKEFFEFDVLPIIISRGCPFNCSYCCNHMLKKIYGCANYVRRHSVEYSIEHIRQALIVYPQAKEIEFFDDTFILNKPWLQKFEKNFPKLSLPFSCNVRFDLIDDETMSLLSRAGCVRINAGVESGDERLRYEVLKRQISNETIISNAHIIKGYGMRLYTHNMVGIPGESEQNILKTITLNRTIKADTVHLSICTPYPATDLRTLCEEKAWINTEKKNSSFWDFSVIRTPYIDHRMVNYYFLIFRSLLYDKAFSQCIKKIVFRFLAINNNFLYRWGRSICYFVSWYWSKLRTPHWTYRTHVPEG